MLRWSALLLIATVLALQMPAIAAQSRPSHDRDERIPPLDPRGERIIEALLIWRLVDELNLSEQQIARIFPQIKALKEIRLELGRRKAQLQEELRALLQQQPRNRDQIRAKIAELEQLRVQIEQRRQLALREIQSVLTVEQQARFVLIQETFEAQTIRMLEEVRRIVQGQSRGQ